MEKNSCFKLYLKRIEYKLLNVLNNLKNIHLICFSYKFNNLL